MSSDRYSWAVLPETFARKKCLIVVTDCFSKWVEAFPLKNIKVLTIARVFVDEIVSRYGVLWKYTYIKGDISSRDFFRSWQACWE